MRIALPFLVAFLFFLSPPLNAGSAPEPEAIADSVPDRPRGTSSPYTHVIPQATSYYLNGPQQAMPPQGSFRPGTKVIILQDMGSYVRVRSEDGVEAAVSSGSLQKIK